MIPKFYMKEVIKREGKLVMITKRKVNMLMMDNKMKAIMIKIMEMKIGKGDLI